MLYASGLIYGAIASALNADGIDPPRGPQKRSNGVGGWMSSCIRAMLYNAKYVGEWRFGVREWGRHPDTERRVVRKFRDASNANDKERLVEQTFPKLAIADHVDPSRDES